MELKFWFKKVTQRMQFMGDVRLRNWLCFIGILLQINFGWSQNIGIGTDFPHSSAALHVWSTDKGILLPRMTAEQRLMIQNPAEGLLVFETSTSSFWYYTNQHWLQLDHWLDSNINSLLSTSGLVGIGTTNPTAKLTVSGIIRSTKPGGSPDGSYISLTSPGGEPGIILVRGDGAGAAARRWDMKIDVDESFRIYDDTANKLMMRIDSTGRVGIGTLAPPATAALYVGSTTKGLLLPRMTKIQRDAISELTEGLMIYCTDCGEGEMEVYNGAFWTNIIGGPSAP